MTTDRPRAEPDPQGRIRELFADALEQPVEARAAFLDAACRDDPALRQRVADLLRANEEAKSFLASAPGSAVELRELSNRIPGKQIGPYRILQTLGEGGMGIVYLAEQTQPIHRHVALKIIKLGMDTRQVVARFETEREALALMNHPNIAKVFDAGTTEQGGPYFVMEHIAGIPITGYCDKHRLTTAERLKLFMDVCHAVQHAHQKGIIHRDIKPNNVLVTVQEGKPTPKVIDFGVAKATQHGLTERTVFTEQGQIIGTPGYMSPEQAEMTALDIDTRTDIYSLGVLLYELLVGSLPFDHKALLKAGFLEIQRIIREVDPQKPSTRLTSLGDASTAVAQNRRTEVRSLAKQLRGDLDWIVMKCLEKDRTRRYDTANGLALEIQRHLNCEPVLAGPPSASYRLRKFVRRNRGAVAAGIAIAAILVGGLIGTSYGLSQAVRAREAEAEQRRAAEANAQRARNEADKTAQFADFMEETLKGVGPSVALGRDTKMLKELMDAAAKRIEAGELDTSGEAEVRLRLTIGGVYRDIAEFNAAEQMLGPAVDLAKRLHGHDSAERASALQEHALWLECVGRTAEALPEHAEALAMNQRLFPGDQPDVAISLGYVARCLGFLGRSAEALPKYEEALVMTRRLFTGDHPDVAFMLSSVASLLNSLGRSVEALSMFEESLAMHQRLFPSDHPEVATILNNLASCLNSLGRSAEALPKYQEALTMYQRLTPGDHPEVAASFSNVASCLKFLGRTAEALPKYEEALAMCQRLFPGDHPNVATILNNVASCLNSLGRSAEALPKYQEALAMTQRLFPGDHPNVASSLNNVAFCLDSLGLLAEALPKHEEALAMNQRLFPGGHPQVAISLNNVAFCLKSQGRPAEALQVYEEALAMCGRVLSADHWRCRIVEVGRGSALVELARYAEARDILVPLWPAIADRADNPKKHKIRCLEALVKLFEGLETIEPSQGHAAKAAEYRRLLDSTRAPIGGEAPGRP